MSQITEGATSLLALAFTDLPGYARSSIYGAEFARLALSEGGELFLTCYGWNRLAHVLPRSWFSEHVYLRRGSRLAGGTGAVYRVPTYDDLGQRLDLVVKFSRFAQHVMLGLSATEREIASEYAQEARWNDPFEEFGVLMDLRRGDFGPRSLRILTKRPLAIYCPPDVHEGWQLGRALHVLERHAMLLQRGQVLSGAPQVVLHPARQYVLLYEWVDGLDAEACHREGLLGADELGALTDRVARELELKGFVVLDNKPRHFILRLTRSGELLRRRGELVYALIDFELLVRTHDYRAFLAGAPQRSGA